MYVKIKEKAKGHLFMKKILLFLVSLILSVSVLVSCDAIGNILIGGSDSQGGNFDTTYKYTDFTDKEKATIKAHLGELIPFVPCDGYSFNKFFDEDREKECVTFCTYGSSLEEFETYRALYSDYTLVDVYVDDDGDTWYCYEKGDIYIEMSYYNFDGYVLDVYAYKNDASDDKNNNNTDDENGNNDGNQGGNTDTEKYTYTDFTSSEKSLITEFLGELIPFAPNNEYYVEKAYDDIYESDYVNFYTFGNTSEDFAAYRALFSSYTLGESFEDDYGDTWYCYEKGDIYIEMSFYYYEDTYVIDLYAYNLSADSGSGDNGDNGDNGSDGEDTIDFLYNDFTSEEKALFTSFLGEVIPFLPNNEYYVEEDYDEFYESDYIAFYTYGNTQFQFDLYRTLFSDYELVDSFEDSYGDTWYCYEKGDIYIEMSFYYYEGDYVIDLYAYNLSGGGNIGGDDEGGDDIGGDDVGGGDDTTVDGVITNDGAGLPQGENGIFNVDFTKGEYAKDVTDLNYYIDGCPTTGSPAVLVIPVDFSDINGRGNSYYSIENIIRAFTGGVGETDYYSVHDYYYITSYGQLDLDITILDEWFVPAYSSIYYEEATYDYYGSEIDIGDQLILDEALAYLAGRMDLSKFDSDGNGTIDAVVMVNTLEINDQSNFNWAYRYWNLYTDDDGYFYEYDNVSANDYMWMSYSFLHESYDANGNTIYTDTSVLNTYTCIHEFGHVLGADDYYDTSYSDNQLLLDGCDIMDGMVGDHNAYTKFNLGWIRSSRLVTTDTSITLTLEAFGKNGDTIIIANNWDEKLGVYQEYYIIAYYTNDGLNAGDGYGYFSRDGIVVYHVNASLIKEDYEGSPFYDIYNNNTDPSDSYGTQDNLIEFVKSAADTFTYIEGDTMPSVTDDLGNRLAYGFTVDSISGDTATITFTKR